MKLSKIKAGSLHTAVVPRALVTVSCHPLLSGTSKMWVWRASSDGLDTWCIEGSLLPMLLMCELYGWARLCAGSKLPLLLEAVVPLQEEMKIVEGAASIDLLKVGYRKETGSLWLPAWIIRSAVFKLQH